MAGSLCQREFLRLALASKKDFGQYDISEAVLKFSRLQIFWQGFLLIFDFINESYQSGMA
jgi:hypothetical protein